MMGTSLDRCLAYVLQETGIPRSRAELSKDYWGHLWRLIDNGIEAIPGVKAILDYLYSCGYLLGVASNSPTSYIAKTTSQVEIAAYFSCMVGADAVGHPKPAPDVYLKAAAHLGLSPEECLAVEDTPSGVRSAISAGMRCILIPDPALPKRDGYGVDAVYPSLIDWHADLDHWLPREPTPKASSRSYQSRNKGACT
jgi:beta-phosphoglucomutase-like phosphatase (HAD superfamily)